MGDTCMLWDDEAMFTKQGAPTLKNNIYLNPTNHGYNGHIIKPSTTPKKSSMLQQPSTLNNLMNRWWANMKRKSLTLHQTLNIKQMCWWQWTDKKKKSLMFQQNSRPLTLNRWWTNMKRKTSLFQQTLNLEQMTHIGRK